VFYSVTRVMLAVFLYIGCRKALW